MKTRSPLALSLICLATSLCAALPAAAATHTAVTTAPRLPFLRGMGFDGYYEDRALQHRPFMTDAGTFTRLAALGFDHVRLPVDFRKFSTYDSATGIATLKENTDTTSWWGTTSRPGFATFDTIIDNAINAGLYIVLDFHGWFDIDPTDDATRAEFKAYWTAVAERYKDYPNQLIFELANEPGVNNGTKVAKMNSLQKETVAIIRQTNPTRLILYAVADSNQPWALTLAQNPPNYGWVSYPANDNNLALVIHCYNPGVFTHQGETWADSSYTNQVRLTNSHRTTLKWDLDQLTLFGRDHDIPLVMNEYSVSHRIADHADIIDYMSTVTRWCESNNVPWAPWMYYALGGGGSMDCFSSSGANAKLFDFIEAALFPDLVTTDKFSASDYAHTIEISFPGYTGAETLADFPVLVRLSESNMPGFSYADFRREGGLDLAFTDASGNLIPHEIDTWDTNGVSTVWVKVPALTASTTITAHYGCAKPIVPKVESVWDSDYVGVWHMGEQKLPLADSTGDSRDVTSADGTGIGYGAAGIVGGSVDFGAASSSSCVNTDDHRELDGFQKFTIEVWTRQDTHSQNSGILSKRNYYGSQVSYYLYDNGSGTVMQLSTNGTDNVSSGISLYPVLSQWNHQVYTVDTTAAENNVRGYLNGAPAGTASKELPGGIFAGTAELHLGNLHSGNAANFPGRIDEVRISKVVRSEAWIKATHDSVANASFARYVVDGVEPPTPTDLADLKLKARTDKANPIDYAVGENIRFDFFLDGVERLPPEATEPLHVIWTRTGDDGITVVGTNAISLAQGFSIDTSLAIPGIERVRATLVDADGSTIHSKSVSSVVFDGGAGAETEKMQLSTVEPADFDAFWAEARAKLASVPFDDASVELVDVTPANVANSCTIYAAKIPCYGPRPVTGWLTIPKNVPEGGLPVQANFDGYGCATNAPTPPTWGVTDQIRFLVNAHGYDLVGRDNKYYKDFSDSINKTNRTFNGTTYGYGLAPQDYDNPSDTYFYYMALRVVRAFDYLKTRPEWNGRDVIAEGGSQGGLQTMWAGGLVDGITKIRPAITWGCDIGCPQNGQGPFLSRSWGMPCVPGAFYFDGALHAKRVPRDCVAQITRLGMGDYTCPPRGVLLSYYSMPCAATANLVQGSNHGYVPPAPKQEWTISKEEAGPDAPAFSLSAAVAPGFAWTNGTATVSAAVTNGVAVPEGAVVRMTISDASGTVLGTADRAWTGDGEYAFDTAEAVSGSALSGYDYTLSFSVLPGSADFQPADPDGTSPGSAGFQPAETSAALRLGSAAPWFSADPATGEISGGAWSGDGGDAVSTSDSLFVLSGGAAFIADASRTGLVRAETALPSNSIVSETSLPTLLAYAAANGERAGLAPVDDGGDIVWHGLVLQDGSLAWKALQGGGGLQSAGSVIPITIELDLSAPAAPRVSYLANGSRLRDATGAEWFPAPGTAAAAQGVIDFHGGGSVGALAGYAYDKAVAETSDGTRHATLAEALAAGDAKLLTNVEWPEGAPVGTTAIDRDGHTLLQGGVAVEGASVIVTAGPVAIAGEGTLRVTFPKLASVGIATAGRTPAQIAADLSAAGANGIPRWQSLVLGLNPANPNSLPLADIAADSAAVTVSDAGLAVDESTGATVTYRVYEIPDLADPSADVPVGEPASPGEPVAIPAAGDPSSRFFRIKVSVVLQ